MPVGSWWTGGVKDNNGVWLWENSSSEMAFTNWEPSQPNNGDEMCVVMSSSGRWSDYGCNYKFSIICEMKYM